MKNFRGYLKSILVFSAIFTTSLYVLHLPSFSDCFRAGIVVGVFYSATFVLLYFLPSWFMPDVSFSGKISLCCGLLGIGLVVFYSTQFLSIPRGTPIRPMAWAAFMFFIAFFSLVFGLPSSVYSFKKNPKWVGITGLALSLAPFPLSSALLNGIAAICGLMIES